MRASRARWRKRRYFTPPAPLNFVEGGARKWHENRWKSKLLPPHAVRGVGGVKAQHQRFEHGNDPFLAACKNQRKSRL